MTEYVRIINKSEDYIENNLCEKITLDNLANYINMSKYHYHKIFKKYSKETINQFVTRVKLERSAIFLKTNLEISITEIAVSYGYCDTSSYCKAFKKFFGMTPTEFRKQQDFTIN